MLHTLRAEPDATASRLAGDLPMTRQAVSKHLGALARAGLVAARREGRETRYTLTPAPLAEAMEWMADAGGFWDRRLDRLAERARGG
jgi:DNA-binding transcriptional ArsR family regulator